MELITLASASPRRLELLKKLDLNVTVKKPNVDETFDPQKNIIDNGIEIALKKLNYIKNNNPDDKWIIAADTFIEINDNILGKPKDYSDAFNMLKLLSNKIHNVITAVTVYSKKVDITLNEVDITEVEFNNLSDSDIRSYLDYNEWIDAAGAYKIQEKGEILVKKINGSFSSVMGLPINLIYGMLKKLNFNYSGN